MKISLFTDAWHPQINGVVRTWTTVIAAAEALGHEVQVVHPALFRTVGAPRYPEIRLAVRPGPGVRRHLDVEAPDAVHIATEGPIGQAARRACLRRGLAFTTSYHTQFPHYMRAYFGVPRSATYAFLRWFHGPSRHVLVPTESVRRELCSHGLPNVRTWCRGVDTVQFRRYGRTRLRNLPRPIHLYAGRVATEKNIEAFLRLDLPGSKVVVGDGPIRHRLQRRHPEVHWAGFRHGEDLGRHYASADVFVFPSRTDTFGVVMLEANAAGLPVAAYPVTGPIDVVQDGVTGILDEDLRSACVRALDLNPEDCREHARGHRWERCAEVLLDHLVSGDGARLETTPAAVLRPGPRPRSTVAPDSMAPRLPRTSSARAS